MPALTGRREASLTMVAVAIVLALVRGDAPEPPQDAASLARRGLDCWRAGDIAAARRAFAGLLVLRRREADARIEEI